MNTQGAAPQLWIEINACDHAFEMMALDRIAASGFDVVNIWSSFEWANAASIDNYYYTLPIQYTRYPQLNALRDAEMIRSGADFLHEYTRRAHQLGLKVHHAYHLCNFTGKRFSAVAQLRSTDPVTGLAEVEPGWFNAQGEVDLSKPDFYEFMVAEIEDFFDAFEHVDGLFCWNCECSSFTPSRLQHQAATHEQIARRAIGAVYEVCQRRGKVMSHDIHSKGADAELTRGIIHAASDCPELVLGGDATYSDWQIHLPTTPWLAEMSERNPMYVGFDVGGEFFGQGRTVGGWPRWLTKHYQAARQYPLAALSVRSAILAAESSCFMVPLLDLNLRVITGLARQDELDLDEVMRRWWRAHFSGELPEGMGEVVRSFEDYIEKALYINGTNITEYNPDHGFPVQAVDIAPGYPVWHSEQFMRPGTPLPESMCRMIPEWGHASRPVAELRQEKLDAMAICDRAIERIEAMTMAAEDRAYFVRRLEQARDVAEAFLLTIEVIGALYQIVGEHHDAAMADPAGELRAGLGRFRDHGDAMERRWGNGFYRRFVPKMRQFADDIPASTYVGDDVGMG